MVSCGVGKKLSSEFPGVWHVGRQAIVWQVGPKTHTWINVNERRHIEHGRALVAELTGEAQGCTVGQQVRALLKWLDWKRDSTERGRAMLSECKWHFFRCRPGEYENQAMWDIDAAYFTTLQRLPSPAVILTAGAPIFAVGTSEQHERWNRILAAVGGHKAMRNSLVGCMAGGGQAGWAFHGGRLHVVNGRRGPLHDCAALVVRTVYDLCEMEAKRQGAIYANTDCVVIEDGRVPEVWPEFGYSFSLDALGDAELVAIGTYRIGEKVSDMYRNGHRHAEWVESPALACSGLTDWLRSA